MAKESKASKAGACRFCGQNVIVEDGAGMTAPQLEEAATMLCGCDEAGEYKQPETVREIMLNAVDAICDKKMKVATVTIRTGLRCRIMQMAKDKIKVVREISDNNEFVQ